MQQLNSGNNSAQSELWQRAHTRWVSDIHQTIDQVGKPSDHETFIAESDLVSLNGNGRMNTGTRRSPAIDRHSLRYRLASRNFNGPLSIRNEDQGDFKLPVPKEQRFVPKEAFTALPPKTHNFDKDYSNYLYLKEDWAEQTPPEPYGGGFKNSLIDGLADIGSALCDVVSFGLRDITSSLFGNRA
jgi:hypothetical protein